MEREKDAILQQRALDILGKHKLTPVSLPDWRRPIWHSSHGVCRTAAGSLVFAKVFPPDLETNANAEVEKQNYFASLQIDQIRPPKILNYYPEDLLVLMEVVNAPALTSLSDPDLHSALDLLAAGLVSVRSQTVSQEPVPIMKTATQIKEASDMTPSAWALRDARNWQENIPSSETDLRRRTQKIVDHLDREGLLPESVWAFGDLAPRHLFSHPTHLTCIDFELARRRADLYDVAYFCHRSLTRAEMGDWPQALDRCRYFLSRLLEQAAPSPSRRQSFRRQIHSIFGLRVIGGFNDLFHFNVGTTSRLHLEALQAWEQGNLLHI